MSQINADENTTEKLEHAFVSSKLDIYNSLLFGLPKQAIDSIQKVQNHAARVVCRVKKFDHITSVLKRQHWLPVRLGIAYILLLMVYKALNGHAPACINKPLEPCVPTRALRSQDKLRLVAPNINKKLLAIEHSGVQAQYSGMKSLWN